jgi:O-antigen ligase
MLGILFLGAAIVWLLAQWRETGRLELSPLGWAAVIFAGAGLLGVLVAPSFWPALVEWTRLASVCVMMLVVERVAARARFRRQVVAAVIVAAVVPLVVAAWQMWSGAGTFDAGGFSRARGTFTHSNPLAAFLALLVIMTFAQVVHLRSTRPRIYASAVCVVAGIGLFATYTRAAWLAAVLGITVIAASRGRRWLGGVVVILLVLLVTVPGVGSRFSDLTQESTSRGEPSNSLTWRAEYWGEALGLQDSPVTGIGLKQVAAQSAEGKQPHNDFLRAYVEMGLIGLAAYLWLMWQVLATGVRAVRATRDGPPENRALAVGAAGVAAGYVLMSLVANLMSQVVVGLYFAAFVAVGAALVGRSRSAALPGLPKVQRSLRGTGTAERREELQCASST